MPGTELDIITSGEKRFDMSDIVNKEQIKKFLDVLKLEYDYVIVDSPPVQPVSDTLILHKHQTIIYLLLGQRRQELCLLCHQLKKSQM